jgi:flagellar biosynthesis/type III secretory pathway chaperone
MKGSRRFTSAPVRPTSAEASQAEQRSASASLADVLTCEIALYEKLLAVLREEENALLANDPRALADRLARKERLILELRLAELSRQALVARITGRADTRLKTLPAAMSSCDLTAARARLLSLLPEVERVNHRVAALVRRSVDRLRSALELTSDTAGD